MPVFKVHVKDTPVDELKDFFCSPTEWYILGLLGKDTKTAPEISRMCTLGMSVATAYSLVGRLTKRGLVVREKKVVSFRGVILERVVYTASFDRVVLPSK